MPIGVTASGDIVFPFQCKGFIEQHRGAAEKAASAQEVDSTSPAKEEKPAVPEPTPAPPERTASKSPEVVEPQSATAVQPVETGPTSKRSQKKARDSDSDSGPAGCSHFRSYDPASETYTDFSGRRRACRSSRANVAGAASRSADR